MNSSGKILHNRRGSLYLKKIFICEQLFQFRSCHIYSTNRILPFTPFLSYRTTAPGFDLSPL